MQQEKLGKKLETADVEQMLKTGALRPMEQGDYEFLAKTSKRNLRGGNSNADHIHVEATPGANGKGNKVKVFKLSKADEEKVSKLEFEKIFEAMTPGNAVADGSGTGMMMYDTGEQLVADVDK